jgi:ADP-ribose pyrophosphatase YjhB (NUDIX family)
VTLNPALAEARFCPRCAAPADVHYPRSLVCSQCGYKAFFNPKPVAAAVVRDASGRFVLLRRGFEPGKGLWTFPGGFVDLGESVEEAAIRETREELAVDIELGRLIGVYSRADDRVALVVFAATTTQKPRTTVEATEVRGFTADELPWGELAFWSTELALRDFLGARS